MTAAPPRDFRAAFEQLRAFIANDIRPFMEQEHGHETFGNYTAVLIVVVGAEALSRLLSQPTLYIFSEFLMRPYGIDRYMAEDVADALRPGLAHVFETKGIRAGKLEFELAVGWGKYRHMTVVREPGAPDCLYLDVRTMWADLQRAFASIGDRLDKEPQAFSIPKDYDVPEHSRTESIPGWKKLFTSNKRD